MAGLVLAVLVAAVVLAGATDRPATPAAGSDLELQTLLDAWSHAVRTGDRAALTQVVDPQAPALLAAEVRRAEALAAVPLTDFGYELGAAPDLDVPGPLADRFAGLPVQIRTIGLRYAVAGLDPVLTSVPATVLFVRRADGWRVASDEAAPGPGATWRGPWDHGPLETVEVGTAGGVSLVLGHPDTRAFAAAIAAELPAAVEAVSALWGPRWPRRALVVATSTREEFVDLVGPRHSGTDIAAVAVSGAIDPVGGTATGQRIVFGPTAADRLDRAGLRQILRHELTHVATRPHTADGAPLWILEGYADHVGYRPVEHAAGALPPVTGADVRRIAPTLAAVPDGGGGLVVPPPDTDFADPARSRLAYEIAWSLAAFVADTAGEATLTTLYRQLAAAPGSGRRVDEVLTAVLGADAGGVAEQWDRWLTSLLASP